MKNKESLIKYYENMLTKVKGAYPISESNSDLRNENHQRYVDCAISKLEAAKNK